MKTYYLIGHKQFAQLIGDITRWYLHNIYFIQYGYIYMSPWLASALVRITIAVVEILTSNGKR